MIAPALTLPPPLPLPLTPLLLIPTASATEAAPLVFALPIVADPVLPQLAEAQVEEEEAELSELTSDASAPIPAMIMLLMSGNASAQTPKEAAPKPLETKIDAAPVGTTGAPAPILLSVSSLSAPSTPESAPKPMPSADAALDQMSAWAAETEELDTLSQDIAALSSPSRRVAFRMEGAQLGMLDVRLQTSDAGVSVGFRTETEQSRAAIAQAQPRLVEDLRATGIRVSDTQVSTDAGTSQRERPAEPQPPQLIEVALLPSDQSPPSPTPPSPVKAAPGRFA